MENLIWIYGKSETQTCQFLTRLLNRWHHDYETNRLKLGISFDQPIFVIFPGIKNRAKCIEYTKEALSEDILLFVVGIEIDQENEFIHHLYEGQAIYYNPKEVEYISARTGLQPKMTLQEAKEKEATWMSFLEPYFDEINKIV